MTTVLITGCDQGLGQEFVRQYAADGARVIATGLGETPAWANESGFRGVDYRKLDVTDHAAIERLADALAGDVIDILVNNAGIWGPHPPFGKTDYTLWRRMFEVNLVAPLKMAESFVEHVASSEMKTIVFISSRMGSIALNNNGTSYAYRSSKAGLNMVAKSLATELAARQICILSLHPGRIGTDAASLSARDSVAGMRGIIGRAGPHQTGAFLSYNDQLLPW